MPNQPINQGEATHIGFQPNGPNGSQDTDKLVIKDLSRPKGHQKSEPLIEFKTSEQVIESDQKSHSEPQQFLAVDDMGLESPIQLIGAQECGEAQSIPTPIESNLGAKEKFKNLCSSDNTIFS